MSKNILYWIQLKVIYPIKEVTTGVLQRMVFASSLFCFTFFFFTKYMNLVLIPFFFLSLQYVKPPLSSISLNSVRITGEFAFYPTLKCQRHFPGQHCISRPTLLLLLSEKLTRVFVSNTEFASQNNLEEN